MERLNPGKIVVIDDELSLRVGAQRILKRMDYEVFLAERGEEGLEILKTEMPGIVLLDMKMPGMDGMEVLEEIMAMDLGIIVIVITGYATVETAIQAMKMGAYDFIPKPYKPDQLRLLITRANETLKLKIEREAMERERKRTLADLNTEQSRIHTILESLPNGVLVTGSDGRVVLLNQACYTHLHLDPQTPPGGPISDYVADPELCSLVMDISRGRYIDYTDIPSKEIKINNETHLLVRCRPVLGERKECMGTVVNIMDITTMKALEELKSEFVAKVSHELRSPLSTIHEQIKMVMGDVGESIGQDDKYMLSRAREKTGGLISTIGDLLDLSRIEAGMGGRELKPVQVDDLLKSIGEFMESRTTAKNQTLTVTTPDTPMPPIKGDLMALESVFGNLISNAINYTPEGGAIRVNADVTGNNIRVSVEDTGFGIPAKYMDKIFDRFYRVKNEKTRYITGTGLGLPIVKGIVDSMNGYIDVESQENQGTTFTVILPLKPVTGTAGII
ncbi:MAG: response regulator [Desulfobacteraceae bacterium]|nr:response regulator [Desulfobacteraceae bacterium]